MDESLASGRVMTVIGVTTVFLALCALITSVVVTAWLIDRPKRRAAVTSAPTDRAVDRTAHPSSVDLERVALAAFAAHLGRRGAAAAAPQAPSRWAFAGRMRLLNRLQR